MSEQLIDPDLELKELELAYKNGFIGLSQYQYQEQKLLLRLERNSWLMRRRLAEIDACYRSFLVPSRLTQA